MIDSLSVIHWPDPRLELRAEPVTNFGPELAALLARMFVVMREEKGVGLAAPQLGISQQIFVCNPTGKPEDDLVYVNPVLSDSQGREVDEEGCLSLPGIRVDVERDLTLTISARDAAGKQFSQTATGYLARIWQHEYDHLVGTLLLDRMGPTARLLHRKAIKSMEAEWAELHPPAVANLSRHPRKPQPAKSRRK